MELKMTAASAHGSNRGASQAAAAILVAVFAYEAWFFNVAGRSGISIAGGAVWACFCIVIFAAIAFHGRPDPARRLFFCTSALAFVPSFVGHLLEARGRMAFTSADVLASQIPFCHIAITTSILPAALMRTLDFPAQLTGSRAAFYPMLAYWLLSLVTVGRGWCSWVCFYGGIEDGISALPRKARLNLGKSGETMRRLNYSILAFAALAGIGTLVPVYCEWLCPFKLVTEYAEPSDLRSYLALIVFVGLFLCLVVILPFLSKKRTQCSILCPFGAMQSLLDRISPFRVSVDVSTCISCGACDRACPMNALDQESRQGGGPHRSCVKCGSCFSACPKGAIGYSASAASRGLGFLAECSFSLRSRGGWVRSSVAMVVDILHDLLSPARLFPFTALSFGMIISTAFSAETMTRLINLAIHGSFLSGGRL
jgi:polyferredoxin